MTLFGWDASHYDGRLSPSILAGARSEGIAFFTHKIGEGLLDTEGTYDDTALAAARTAGIPLIGGYLVPRSNASAADQVDHWIGLADAGEPWWRDFPGWFWQIDLERWSYDAVPAAVGIAAAQLLRAKTGKWTILYASQGQYGNQLAAWDGPMWNAHYTNSAAYPGDNWSAGWGSYSGKEPTFLQYTSSATIAGLTTCDRNAFRGTLDQLLALTSGDGMSAHTEAVLDAWAVGNPKASDGTAVEPVVWEVRREAREKAADATQAQILAAVKALGSPDPTAIAAELAGNAAFVGAITAALAGLVPTLEELRGIVDAAVKARLDGATVHTAGS